MRMNQNERGATTVVAILLIGGLLAAAGIGIDTTSMSYQRSRLQHAADASALAVAQTCKAGTCNSALASTFLNSNADGGGTDATPSVSIGSTSVTVSLTKNVHTLFFGLLGTASKGVSATSTASWSTSPTKGTVIPFLVSLCQYTNAGLNVDTFLDAGSNQRFKTNKQSYEGKAQSVLANSPLNELVSCNTIPSGVTLPTSTRMIKGGIWPTSNGGCGNGSLNNGRATLNVNDTNAEFGDLCAANIQQADKYGDGDADDIAPNTLALFAIYGPTRNYDYGGVRTEGDGTAASSLISSPVQVYGKIVGFAPFFVTGYRLGNGTCRGSCPTSAVGIWGKFVNAISPDATYMPGGPNIGSVVKLIS